MLDLLNHCSNISIQHRVILYNKNDHVKVSTFFKINVVQHFTYGFKDENLKKLVLSRVLSLSAEEIAGEIIDEGIDVKALCIKSKEWTLFFILHFLSQY